MKMVKQVMVGIAASLIAQAALAGEITDSYATGDTLSATHMTNIKGAVNDNNTRIGVLESTSDTLANLTCAADEVPKFNGTAWACAPDIDTNSGGTITGVTAGTGLTGGGNTGPISIGVDPAQVQSRVTGACAVNQSIRTINEDGSVTCEVDSVGTDTLGSLSCTTDQYAKWNGSAWVCSGQATRSFSINVYGAHLAGSATFGRGFLDSGAVIFPEDVSSPELNYNFMVPEDRVPSTNLYVDIIWRSSGISGQVNIRHNWGTNQRIGATAQDFNISDPSPVDTSTSAVETIFVSTFTFPTTIQNGDFISHGIFRSAASAADTSTDDIVIGGIRVRYTAYE
jgi:hypothetical protein